MTATARVIEFPEPFSLDALVARCLADTDSPDPHETARAVADAIPAEELRGVVARLLPGHVRLVATKPRARLIGARRGSARWNAVAEAAEDIAIFRVPVCVNGAWKYLGDCTRQDVAAVAGDYRGLAAANTARADAFEALATLMTRRQAQRVDALPASAVEEALS